jgi:hypothetical protein
VRPAHRPVDHRRRSRRCPARAWKGLTDEAEQIVLEPRLDAVFAEHRSSTDDFKIAELKRRKLQLKDEIERLRHDRAL